VLNRLASVMTRITEIEGRLEGVRPRGLALGQGCGFAGALERASAPSPRAPATIRGTGAFDAIISEAATATGLSADLIHAVVRAESAYDPHCRSSAGAMGLMQLMPGTARALGVTDPWDPSQNVHGGARYLREQLDRFGDLTLALAAYNAGPGAVQRHGGVPPYEETQTYVRRVQRYLQGRMTAR
jgi:soluble lytic murein transglycosylase-like protein